MRIQYSAASQRVLNLHRPMQTTKALIHAKPCSSNVHFHYRAILHDTTQTPNVLNMFHLTESRARLPNSVLPDDFLRLLTIWQWSCVKLKTCLLM